MDKIRTELRATSKLRTILSEDGRCFIQELIKDQDNVYSRVISPGTNNNKKQSKRRNLNKKWIKEILVYKSDGTLINELFNEVVKNLIEKEKNASWGLEN